MSKTVSRTFGGCRPITVPGLRLSARSEHDLGMYVPFSMNREVES